VRAAYLSFWNFLAGPVLLGFPFCFLDACIAPIFIPMAFLLLPGFLASVVLVFCLGVVVHSLTLGFLLAL
jgi:hypothetical protein